LKTLQIKYYKIRKNQTYKNSQKEMRFSKKTVRET